MGLYVALMLFSPVSHAADPAVGILQKIVPCDGACALNETGCVPCDYDQFKALIDRGIKFLLYASMLVIVYLLILNGFKYLTARGNPGAVKSAKESLWKVTLGLIIMLMAYTVAQYFLGQILDPEFILLDVMQ
jgi:hypothetical protein